MFTDTLQYQHPEMFLTALTRQNDEYGIGLYVTGSISKGTKICGFKGDRLDILEDNPEIYQPRFIVPLPWNKKKEKAFSYPFSFHMDCTKYADIIRLILFFFCFFY